MSIDVDTACIYVLSLAILHPAAVLFSCAFSSHQLQRLILLLQAMIVAKLVFDTVNRGQEQLHYAPR